MTGAGGGIGFETARALLWHGASLTIAEIDINSGKSAVELLEDDFGDPACAPEAVLTPIDADQRLGVLVSVSSTGGP